MQTVKVGDVFVKNDRVESSFKVDKILEDMCPAPHVRLTEQGGNFRTITVALAVLLDEKFWYRQGDEKPEHKSWEEKK